MFPTQQADVDIDKTLVAATEAMNELDELATDCRRTDPNSSRWEDQRLDVLEVYLAEYDLRIQKDVAQCLKYYLNHAENTDTLMSQAVLQAMDFIVSYEKTLVHCVQETPLEKGSALYNHSKRGRLLGKKCLEPFTEVYAERVAPVISEGCENVADANAIAPSKRVRRTAGGQFFTPGPVDFFALVDTHMTVAQESGSDMLLARIIALCLDQLAQYVDRVVSHALKNDGDAITPMDYVCALLNDNDDILDYLMQLEDTYPTITKDHLVSAAIDKARGVLNERVEELVGYLVKIVVFPDLRDTPSIVFFDEAWHAGDATALETLSVTLCDYLDDFRRGLSETYYHRVARALFAEATVLCLSPVALGAPPNTAAKSGGRNKLVGALTSKMMGAFKSTANQGTSSISVSLDDAAHIKRDIEALKQSFAGFIPERPGPERFFRNQQLAVDVVHAIFTLPVSEFSCETKAHGKVPFMMLVEQYDEDLTTIIVESGQPFAAHLLSVAEVRVTPHLTGSSAYTMAV